VLNIPLYISTTSSRRFGDTVHVSLISATDNYTLRAGQIQDPPSLNCVTYYGISIAGRTNKYEYTCLHHWFNLQCRIIIRTSNVPFNSRLVATKRTAMLSPSKLELCLYRSSYFTNTHTHPSWWQGLQSHVTEATSHPHNAYRSI